VIVTTIDATVANRGAGVGPSFSRCLARRGMLHSECESFDYLQLAPATVFSPPGVEGTESVLFLLSGTATLTDPSTKADYAELSSGSLICVSPSTDMILRVGPMGVELLWLELLTARTISALPRRRPCVSDSHG
jgi:hypothetical protein